jgi:alanyl-tRNA synthetase
MSAPLKAELRARIEAIQKKGIEAKKAALAGRVDRCLNDVKAQIEDALAKDIRAIVLNVDIGADSKASQKIIKAVQLIAPNVAFMGLSEEEVGSGGKLLAFAVVPGSLTDAGFKADEWIRSTLEACGGRGGGTPGSAQGQAKECKNVDEVLAAAIVFAESKVEATTL